MRNLFMLIAAIIVAPSCGLAQATQVYEEFVKPNDLFRDDRVYYIPPHTQGDRDFKNQVFLRINVHLRISQTRNQLEAIIMMVADEHRPDWTTAAGSTGWIPVYAAQLGRIIAYLIDLNGNRTNKSLTGWVIISPPIPAANNFYCQDSISLTITSLWRTRTEMRPVHAPECLYFSGQ